MTKKIKRDPKQAKQISREKTGINQRQLFWIGIVAILAIAVLAYFIIFDKKLDLGGDNAAYYLLGKGLASGEGYVNTWAADKIPANHFPPGYPALIGLVMLVSQNIVTIKIVNGVFFFASIFLIILFLKQLEWPPLLIAVVGAILAMNSHLLRYSTIMMSEIPFLFFSVLALLLTIKLKSENKPYKDPLLLGLILCLAATYYLRTIGIAVVFGIFVYLALRKAWLHIGTIAGGFFLLVFPWFLRGQRLGGNVYLRQILFKNPYRPELGAMRISDVFTRFFKNLVRHVSSEIPGGCFPFLEKTIRNEPIWGWIIGVAILGLLVFGIFQLSKYRMLIAGYLVGTFGIVLLWPDVWIGVRFIIAAVPLLIALTFWGLYKFMIKIIFSGREMPNTPLLFSVILIFSFTTIKQLRNDAKRPYPPNWNNYFTAANWANRNISEDDVVCCRKPELFSLFSNRYTVRYAFSTDAAHVINRMEEKSVDYVVIDQLGFSSTPRYLVPAVRAYPNRFATVLHLKNPDTFILRMIH